MPGAGSVRASIPARGATMTWSAIRFPTGVVPDETPPAEVATVFAAVTGRAGTVTSEVVARFPAGSERTHGIRSAPTASRVGGVAGSALVHAGADSTFDAA